jgi:outer membrane protein, heavy metal efflux system
MRRVRLGICVVISIATSSIGLAQTQSPTPLTLDAAIAEALEKNLDLIATRAGIPIAEANPITAQLRPNPVLSLDANHLDLLAPASMRRTLAALWSTVPVWTFCLSVAPSARGA